MKRAREVGDESSNNSDLGIGSWLVRPSLRGPRRGRFRARLKRWEMVDRLSAGLIIRFFGVIGGPFEGEIDTAHDRAVTPDDDPLFGRCPE